MNSFYVQARPACFKHTLYLILISLLLTSRTMFAQVALGTPNFSASDVHYYESVNILDNNVILSVPGMSKAGQLPFSFQMAANSSMINGLNVRGTWGPTMAYNIGSISGAPFSASVNNAVGPSYLGLNFTYQTTQTCYGNPNALFYYGWEVVDSFGTVHPLPWGDYITDDSNCQQAFTDTTIDGSGYTATVSWFSVGPSHIYNRDGTLYSSSTWSMTDRNGNAVSYSSSSKVWTDSMGLTTLTSTGGTAPSYKWTDVNGGAPAINQTTTNLTLETNFGCSGITDLNNSSSTAMTTGFTLADGTSLAYSYEGTPSHSGKYTGRIYQVTFPQGGYVQYTYSGGLNGIDCTYQNPPVLTRKLSNGDTTTYTLSHNLVSGSNYNAVNAVVDPGGNETDYTFTGFTSTGPSSSYAQVLTQVAKYQGHGSSKTLLETEYYCYNTAFTSCSQSASVGASVYFPVSTLIVFRQLSGMSNWAATETHYDTYGSVTYSAKYDFGASTPAQSTSVTYGSCSSNCTTSTPTITAIGSNIYDRPGKVVSTQNGTTVAQANYSYDSHGNLLSKQLWNGSVFIGQTTNNTFNTNGTPLTTYDLANNQTSYGYSSGSYVGCGSCTQYPFPTSISKGGLTINATYNGTGGVKLTDLDANGNKSMYCYNTGTNCSGGTADPYWRVLQAIDPYGATAINTYPTGSSPDTGGTSFTFNSGNSINSTTITTDGLGREINSQTAQSPSGANYDTVSTTYGWLGNYQAAYTSQPCSTTKGMSCSTAHTMETDPLGRAYIWSTTNNETLTLTYTQNDALAVLSPAPSGENSKQVQNQYDGLGRVTSTCQISSTVSGNVTCGQNTNTSAKGIVTTTSYSSASGSTTVSSTRGSQTRSETFDALGRLTQKTTPEGGTWHYYYDTAACAHSGASPGNLTCSTDPSGVTTIYFYDPLNRLHDVNAIGSYCRRYRYDTGNNAVTGTVPPGVTLANVAGRIVEAETDNCLIPISPITDEWFSYDQDGRVTDMWELTPHSTQYYHSVATFFENGTVKTVQLASPALYTMTYGLEGEGRWNTVLSTAGGTSNMVTGATFYPAANPAVVSLRGTDKDSYTIDSNTGRITNFAFTVGSSSETGALTWSPNGTLKTLGITDGFNSGGTQTCHFNPTDASSTGYDDVMRLVGVDCGSGQWGQTFSYDQYNNLTKAVISGRIGTTYNPGYSSTTNHCNICSYDSDGNVTADGNNTYGWDGYSKLAWSASSGTPTCGSSGMCITYDAFGRIVETSNGSSWQERWMTQSGVVTMAGSSISNAYWDSPEGGSVLIFGNDSSHYYLHKDWLGSARVASSIFNFTWSADHAYSPYGEVYDSFGSGNQQIMFAGLTDNFDNGVMWDTPNRELSVVGRWLSPDPAGAGWNQYAYPTNPNSLTDPGGLYPLVTQTNNVNWQALDPQSSFNLGCYIDGMPASCSQAAALIQSGGAGSLSNCDLFGCDTIRQGADGRSGWQQLVGWSYDPNTTTYSTDENGQPQWTVSPSYLPVWVDIPDPTLAQGPAANNWGPLYPPSMFTRGSNMPIVSQWRPPKPTDIVTGPPAPYKPSVVDCMTGPNDAVDRMTENAPPIEHDPSAGGVVWQPGNRGAYPVTSPETTEGANALTVLFAGFLNWVGCMANVF